MVPISEEGRSQPALSPAPRFSPSGWDNEKKIAILHENFQTIKLDDTFEDVIVKPPVRKVRALRCKEGCVRVCVCVA